MMEDKIIKEDIGLVDEILELCKNLVSIESHAFSSYVSSKNEKFLKISKKARELRTKYLSTITKNESQSWCFVPKTKIIVSGGLKDIEKIEIGDNVLTHKNRFRKVTQTYKRKVNEEIIKIKTNYTNIPLKVTGNHLFYVAENLRTPQKDLWRKNYKKPKFIWKEAENLTRNDFLYLPRYNIIKDVEEISVDYLNKKKFVNFSESITLNVDNNLMRLIGLYLAEGHHSEGFESKHGYPSGYVGFSFSLKEENLSRFVYESMGNYFSSYRKPNYRKSTIEFCYGKRIIRKFFNQFGNFAHTKKIPSWIIDLPEEKLLHLVKGMFEGDGSIAKFDFKYFTVSREMAYGLRLILNKLGIICNLSNRGKQKDSFMGERKIIAKHDSYPLSVSGDSARKLADLLGVKYDGGKKTSGQFGYVGKDYFLIPILKIEKLNYFGEVYNLEVEEDESYCTFNGVAHNCISKHICESLMRLQECYTRFISTGQIEDAKVCSEDYFDMYALFILLNDLDKDIKTKSSA